MSAAIDGGDPGWRATGHVITELALDHGGKRRWWLAFLAASGMVGVLAAAVGWLLLRGVGVWANNIPVTWALDIVGYDWWIGVATGSLALAAGLVLSGAVWRGPVNRIAEATALLGVAAAGLYPIIHLGRPWFFYWNLPYTNTFLLWPQVRSPLFWDAVDIIACLGVAFLMWFTALLPDLASMRDRSIERALRDPEPPHGPARHRRALLYGIVSLGWRGSATHWVRWTEACRALAWCALVLVVCLQTGAAVMFAGSVEPGWHDALLPVEYILGAVESGVAVTALLLVGVRQVFGLQALVPRLTLDRLAWLMLLAGLGLLYCTLTAGLTTALAGSAYDRAALIRRFAGPHGWSGWVAVLGMSGAVQAFWVPALRRSPWAVAVVAAVVAFGAWADHFMVIVVTLQHDFLPSSDHPYTTDLVAVATFLGTMGLFALLFLLALRTLPALSITALRRPLHLAQAQAQDGA